MKTLSYDDVYIGQNFMPVDFLITQELVDNYFAALQLDRTFYHELGVLPAALIERCCRLPMLLKLTWPSTIHAEQYNEYYGTLKVGDVITAVASIKDKYVKNQRKYLKIEATMKNDNDKLVGIATSTITLP